MTEVHANSAAGPLSQIYINEVPVDAPWMWLAAGWRDLWKRPLLSLGYGVSFSLISFAIVYALQSADAAALSLAAAGGFMLLGPMLAVGLYELSRRLEAGEPTPAGAILFVATKSPTQLGYLGVALMVVLLLWIRVAMLLFALFQGPQGFPPLDEFMSSLITTQNGIGLLVTGTIIGGGMALAVFAISAVAAPLLLDRDIDVMSAIITSIKTFNQNTGAMLLWAALIAVFGAIGLVTAFIGMIITFPLLGHTTWHAYRALIKVAPSAS
ncbi:MAG: DUF2189 domain-containing protein [Pseudomonadota bacterium]